MEKVSLSDQEAKCREAALAKGWRETAGPFVVPGQSRTRWINLSDAARAIPALEALLASARAHEFDVLVLWDFTRLRDLLRPLSAALADQRIQLYSLAQPVEPIDPRTYDSSLTDTAEILEDAMSMASRLEGKHRVRRWRTGMLARVQSGLNSGLPPFGYRKPLGREFDHKAVLEIDPEQADLLKVLKNMLLAGRSLPQLQEFANLSGIPAPRAGRWTHNTIRLMLVNPFYCGTVIFGRMLSHRDRLVGKTIRTRGDSEQILQIPGQHEPLWDQETRARILAELRRRGHAFTGRSTWQLSQLLRCGACGAPMWIYWGGDYPKHRQLYWRCRESTRGAKGHTHIKNDEALDRIGKEIVRSLKHLDQVHRPAREDSRPSLRAELADLLQRRQRWQDAFEAGTLKAELFCRRTDELDELISTKRRKLESLDTEEAEVDRRRAALTAWAEDVEEIPYVLLHAEKQEANAQLRYFIEFVTVRKDHSIQITWR